MDDAAEPNPAAGPSSLVRATWRAGSRVLMGSAALAGAAVTASDLGSAPAVAAVIFGVAYAALVVLLLRERRSVPLMAQLALDGGVFVAGQLALTNARLLPLALLAPVPVVAALGHEEGRELAVRAAAAATAVLALVVAFGPGPSPSWRDGVGVLGSGLLCAFVAIAASGVHELEQSIAAERAELEEFRRTIVTTVSHELRTPLTVIQGLTTALTSRWDALPETRRLDLVDTLALNVASLDSSVLHFLDAGRLAKGEWEVRPEELDVAAAVKGVTGKLEAVLAGYEIVERLESPTVWADKEAFERIVELLLVNACRFAPAGTPIGIRTGGNPATGVELAVSDRGQGIAPRDLGKVFDPLWRSDVADSGVSRGAGLGLAIVRQLAQAHGGEVTVASARGRGSTFRVTFPAMDRSLTK